jgi:hypothetical protein
MLALELLAQICDETSESPQHQVVFLTWSQMDHIKIVLALGPVETVDVVDAIDSFQNIYWSFFDCRRCHVSLDRFLIDREIDTSNTNLYRDTFLASSSGFIKINGPGPEIVS